MSDGNGYENGDGTAAVESPPPTKVCPRCAVQQQTHGTFCAHCGSHFDSRHAGGMRAYVGRHVRRWGWPARTALVGAAVLVVCTPAAYALGAEFASQIHDVVSEDALSWLGEILGIDASASSDPDVLLMIAFVASVVGMVLGFALFLLGGILTLFGMGRAAREDERTQRAVAVSRDVGRKGVETGRKGVEAGREVGGRGLEVGREVGGRGLEVGRDLGTLGVAVGRDVGRKGLDSGRQLGAKGLASGRRRLAERRGLPVEEPPAPAATPALPPPTGENASLASGDPLRPPAPRAGEDRS